MEEAIAAFERQITIAETLNDQNSLAIGLNCLGGLLQQQGRVEEAIAAFERTISIEEMLGDSRGLAMALSGLSSGLKAKGDLQSAILVLNRIVFLEEKLGNPVRKAMTLRTLGHLLRQQKDFPSAIDVMRQAVEFDKQLNQTQQVRSLVILAEVLHEYGCTLLKDWDTLDESEVILRESSQIFAQIGETFRMAAALHSLGRALKKMNRLEDAENVLQESRDKFTVLKDIKQLLMVLNTLGSVLECKKDWQASEKALREGFNLAHKEKDILSEAVICNSLAQLLSNPRRGKDFGAAKMYFLRSIKLVQGSDAIDYNKHLAKAHKAWGQALINEGKLEEAIAELIKGFEVDEKLVNISGLVKITHNLTDTLIKAGRKQDALAYCRRAVIAADNHPDLIRLQNTLML